MNPSKHLTAAFLVSAGIALAACGSGSSSNSSKTSAPASSGGTTVSAKQSSLGTLLVGPTGRTLYLFEKDDRDESYCKGACASQWPPLTTSGGAKAAGGASAAMLGTFKRPDGKTQVAYAGHPLYYYAGDSKPGDTNGQDLKAFGAEWYALSPQGNTIEGKSSGHSGGSMDDSGKSSGSSGSGGYGY